MRVNICGVPHDVVFVKENFDADQVHLGQINYKEAKIIINEDMGEEMKTQTLCHEMIHGILVHLGYGELSQNETLVQSLAVAVGLGFKIKELN